MISFNDVKNAKSVATVLVIAAVITFFIGSSKIYAFSLKEPVIYEVNVARLTKPERVFAKSMYSTGKTTYSINHGKNPRSKKNFDLFDDISRRHSK